MNIKLYWAWASMKQRCTNPNHPQYADYGARGVTVCERWMSYDNFKEDMETTHAPTLTLDRVDNNGNYEPSNCKWSTQTSQQLNRRDSRWWYIDGVKYESCVEAASALGVHHATILRWCKTKPGCHSKPKYEVTQ